MGDLLTAPRRRRTPAQAAALQRVRAALPDRPPLPMPPTPRERAYAAQSAAIARLRRKVALAQAAADTTGSNLNRPAQMEQQVGPYTVRPPAGQILVPVTPDDA